MSTSATKIIIIEETVGEPLQAAASSVVSRQVTLQLGSNVKPAEAGAIVAKAMQAMQKS